MRLCFAAVFVGMWAHARRDIYLLLWGLSAVLLAGGLLSTLFLVPFNEYLDGPQGLVCYTVLGSAFTLSWVGLRRFDGMRTSVLIATLSATAPGLAYSVTLLLGQPAPVAFSAMFLGMLVGNALFAHDLLVRTNGLALFRYMAALSPVLYCIAFSVAAWLALSETATTGGVVGSDVLALGVDQFCALLTNVALLALASERARTELKRLADCDPLTGLLNRRGLISKANTILPSRQGEQDSLALLVADIDHFKNINDQHGHHTGDQLLILFSDRIRNLLMPSSELIARYGGEEFVALLSGVTLAEAKAVAESFRTTVEAEPFLLDGHVIAMTVSIGVAMVKPAEPIHSAINRADTALYAAKRAGRNRVMA